MFNPVKLAAIYAHNLRTQEVEYMEQVRRTGRTNYCAHGNYVGDWSGPDYICGKCENGVTVQEEALEYGHATAMRLNAAVTVARVLRNGGNLTADEYARVMADIHRQAPVDTRPRPRLP